MDVIQQLSQEKNDFRPYNVCASSLLKRTSQFFQVCSWPCPRIQLCQRSSLWSPRVAWFERKSRRYG